jgi:prolyl oligopeptidase
VRTLAFVILAACSGGATPTKPVATTPASPVAAPTARQERPPAAARRPVTDTYHGVAVEDPYRWLETDDAETGAWSDAQNAFARKYLDAIPGRAAIHDEIAKIVTAPVTRYYGVKAAGGKVFAMRKDPTREQPELVVADSPDALDKASVVLDPTKRFDSHTSIDFYVPSPDGKKVAISIASGGSENGTLYILDLEGKDVDTPIPDVERGTGGGDVAWRPDGKGIFYTRYPAKGERPDGDTDFWMTVWTHELGAPRDKDKKEMGDGLPKVAEIKLVADAKGRVLASVQDGDGGKFRHYLRDPKGKWRQLTDWGDGIVFVGFGPTNDLWMVSHKDAPRGKVLRLSSTSGDLTQAKQIVAEGDSIITDFYSGNGLVVTRDHVYANYQLGGPSELRSFSLAGKPEPGPKIPPVSSVGFPIPWGNGVVLPVSSYVRPRTWYRFDPAKGSTDTLAISESSPMNLDNFEVRRDTFESTGGAKVPINIVWRKGAKQDGTTPCLVTGYGGFAINIEPHFLEATGPLLERGMCFAEINLRGGAEFGEDWHHAGMLVNKQNVFDDFANGLRYLIANKYSAPDRIAIRGGSNGGLLMGALVTQHPELMRVVVSSVGIYDMIRNEKSANGQFNIAEFGSVGDAKQFAALYAYSPYHHVKPSTQYPAVLMTTGANDPRVPPWQSRKMIAALQAAQVADHPILLRTNKNAGHGAGSMTEVIDLGTDVASFVLNELGLARDTVAR